MKQSQVAMSTNNRDRPSARDAGRRAWSRRLARDAQTQFVLPLHARRHVDASLGGRDDEVLACRRIDVVHDVRKAGGDVRADFFERIVDHSVGLPVRAPVTVVSVRVGAAIFRTCDARQLCGWLRMQLLEIGRLDDVLERRAHVSRLVRRRGLCCLRGAREQHGRAESKREAVSEMRRAAIE